MNQQPEQRRQQPRSGETSRAGSRSGAGCLILFGLPFLAFGLTFVSGPWVGLKGSESFGMKIFMSLFGAIFALVGAAVMYSGVATFMGWTKITIGPAGAVFSGTDYRTSPNFPPIKKIKRSPRGGFILTAVDSKGSPMALFVGALLWNGISMTAFYMICRKAREVHWVVFIFIGIFVLIGLGIIYAFIAALYRRMVLGVPTVEVRAVPLNPGEKSRVIVTVPRDLIIEVATLSLECEEVAVHGSGTDAVTHRETVRKEKIMEKLSLRTTPGRPAMECELIIPPDAVHSFKASKNWITWGLRLKLEISGKPDLDSFYVLPVGANG